MNILSFKRAGRALAAGIIFFLVPAGTAVSQPERVPVPGPRLFIVAEPSDSVTARSVAAILSDAVPSVERFFGCRLTDTVVVFIENSPQKFRARTGAQIPDWGEAVAFPDIGKIVIKSPVLASRDAGVFQPLDQVVVHELAHLALARACRSGTSVPRWFDEGCAMAAAGESREGLGLQRSRWTGSLPSLASLDDVLQFDPIRAQVAYEQSHAAVQFLLETNGPDVVARILAAMDSTVSFEEAFQLRTGSSVHEFERRWHASLGPPGWFVWLRSADDFLWFLFIPLLFLILWAVKYVRSRQRLKEWEREEGDSD